MLCISAMTALGLALGEPLFVALVSDNRFDILLALATSGAVCLLLVLVSSKSLLLKLHLLIIKRASKNGIEERASLD
jgi:hypothetical protein